MLMIVTGSPLDIGSEMPSELKLARVIHGGFTIFLTAVDDSKALRELDLGMSFSRCSVLGTMTTLTAESIWALEKSLGPC